MRRLLVIALLLAATGCADQRSAAPSVRVTRGIPYAERAQLDVFSPPSARGGAPVVVTVHGCCGGGADLFQLAYGLAAEGAVVFNPSYRNLGDGGGYPAVYQQAACAIGFARARASRYGGDPQRVTVVGWSDGALVGGALANGAAELFSAGDCAVPSGTDPAPDAFVAVGGFLGWPVDGNGVDARYVNDGSVRWFGGPPEIAPDAWRDGNPYTGLGRNPKVAIRLIVGREDVLFDDNQRFLDAARRAGLDASLTIAEEAGEQTVVAPRTREGKLTVRTILEVALP